VAALESSVRFFQELLGCELVFAREIHDDYFGQIVGLPGCAVKAAHLRLPGGHVVELFQYLSPSGEPHRPRPCDPGSTHLSLLVADLPALYRELSAKGVRFVSAPVPITAGPNRGAWALYMQDPNGILIELFQRP
jgi:catechol 2,3-dioxygenase-like lactoylglutathione lyase family enzyme